MNALVPIDSKDLALVTGGGSSTKNLDALLGTLHSVTSSINEFKAKTSGLGQTEMLFLCMLAMQKRSSNVVVVGRPPGCWW